MEIRFHGAAGCVTGSCYQVTCGKTRFLVDCGMFQGNKVLKQFNYREFPFAPGEIDFVVLTHAHIDHTGLLPKLVKMGFKGPIYATAPTADLLGYLLPDSARIQQSEVEMKNRRNERKGVDVLQPIYDEEDARRTIGLLKGVSLNATQTLADGVAVTWRNAGHIFGSSFLEIQLSEGSTQRKIVFSGDLGGLNHPIVKDPETVIDADVILVESTYGNRVRENDSNEERLKQLAEVIKHAITRGGNLIIPSFALERTQDLMHDMTLLMERGAIPETSIVVDSPLAIDATKVYAKYPEYLDEDATSLLKRQGNLFDHARFRFLKSPDDSRALNGTNGNIILSASGMCDAGRIKHHLKHNLWRRESTVLFVGFQAEGTLGRLLLDGAKRVRIHSEEVKVEARIEQIMGYSGHADQKGLMEWLGAVKQLRHGLFVIHGEDDARTEFTRLAHERFGWNCAAPELDSAWDLASFTMLQPGLSGCFAPETGAPVPVPAAAASRKAPPAKTPVAAPPVTAPGRYAPTPLPRTDSYNLYADLSLRLADFMRRTGDERERRAVLEKLLGTLPNGR